MKKSTDSLHRLLRGLNKTEKRMFSQVLKQGTDGKLGRAQYDLARAISKQPHYDEDPLKAAFPASKTSKSFAELKHRLQDALIAFLDEQESESRWTYRLAREIRRADILGNRLIFDLAWRKAMKARKETLKFEQLDLALNALQVLQRISERFQNEEAVLKHRPQFAQERYDLLQRWHLLNELHMKYQKILATFRERGEASVDEDYAAYRAIVDPEEFRQRDFPGFRLSTLKHLILSIYCNANHQKEAYFNHKQEYVKLYDEYPHFIGYQPREYGIGLLNLIYASLEVERFREGRNASDRLLSLAKRYDVIKPLLIYMWEFTLAETLHYKQYTKGEQLLTELEAELAERDVPLDPGMQQILAYQAATIHIFRADYRRARQWLDPVVWQDHKGMRKDFRYLLTWQKMVVDFRLKSANLLRRNLEWLQEESTEAPSVLRDVAEQLGRAFLDMLAHPDREKQQKAALARRLTEEFKDSEEVKQMLKRFPLTDWLLEKQ